MVVVVVAAAAVGVGVGVGVVVDVVVVVVVDVVVVVVVLVLVVVVVVVVVNIIVVARQSVMLYSSSRPNCAQGRKGKMFCPRDARTLSLYWHIVRTVDPDNVPEA